MSTLGERGKSFRVGLSQYLILDKQSVSEANLSISALLCCGLHLGAVPGHGVLISTGIGMVPACSGVLCPYHNDICPDEPSDKHL